MPSFADAPDSGGWATPPAGAAATTGPTTGGAPSADDRFQDALAAALAPSLALERELTGGGMARVFVAVEVALGRRVVVKVLPPDLAAGVNKERFRREIQLAAQLQHPHIVPLLAAGEVAAGDAAGSLYYTMPFIEGESLRAEAAARAARGATFTSREVLRILRGVADALGYAHARGVVHRDVKPGNVLLLHGHALVTDFGVAKALAGDFVGRRDPNGRLSAPPALTLPMTTLGMAIGTPAYMAPEQLAADPAADHRVDLYAAGLVAYELLTGASPFAEASPQATLAAQLTREPPPLRTVRPDVPPALAAAVTCCLAKDPAARPATAAALLAMLDTVDEATPSVAGTPASMLAAATPATLPAVAPAARTADVPATAAVPAPGAMTAMVARAPRRVRGGVLLVAGALLAAGGAAWVAVGRAGAHGPSASTATARPARAAAQAPGQAAAAPSATPALSRADSVAIAAAVAREFERALARRQAAGGTPPAAAPASAAGAAGAAATGRGPRGGTRGTGAPFGTSAGGWPGPGPAPSLGDAAGALRREARDAVTDSLVHAEHWGRYSREMVRAVVGRLPVPLPPAAPPPPDARRALDGARVQGEDMWRRWPALPSGPGAGVGSEMSMAVRGRYRGFAAVAARIAPPRAGVRRVALVSMRDATGERALVPLAPMLDVALRARLGAAGRYELTDAAVAAVARREHVPDSLVAGATGAGAVARGEVDRAGDVVVATVLVFDARRGTQARVEARAAAAPGAPLPAVADALAEPLARGVERALGEVAWDARP